MSQPPISPNGGPQFDPANRPPARGRSAPSGSYGYGYGGGGGGGYGYGYGAEGYGAGADATPHRSIKDYLVMFRERIWIFILVFALVLSLSIVLTYTATPVYESVATVEILRNDPNVLRSSGTAVDFNEIRSTEDLNTQVLILESAEIVEKVEQRLSADERQRFMQPYRDALSLSGPLTPAIVLMKNRRVVPARLSRVVAVYFQHPDRDIAARVANLFVEEFINHNLSRSIDASMKNVEDLQIRVAQQRVEVERIRGALADFRERHSNVSLDGQENIAIQELARLNDLMVEAKTLYDRSRTRWEQINEFREQGKSLWEIAFIAQNRRVAELLSSVSENKIQISTLEQRYRDKHPRMIAAREALRQAETELTRAINSAVQEAEASFLEARSNHEQSVLRLRNQETQLLALSRLRVEYDSLESDLRVQELFYQDLVARFSSESTQVNIKNPNAHRMDIARPSTVPAKPRPALNIALGFVGGVGLGVVIVFGIAFLDDRVKTAFDIEGIVGIPLIGIVPKIKRLDAAEKAQVAAGNQDRHVTEAFRSIYSTLRLNEVSRDAQVILTTSTVPSEGKSFCSTNLALTYAVHGEKVLLVDGDLRLPNVAKSLQIEVERGMVTYFEQGHPLDSCIVEDLYPNFDVLPAGMKAKNPTQILNSSRMSELMQELRKKYTKIIIDTPPLAAVSDTLNMLSLADGVVYVIKFNTVKRRSAKLNVRRLLESSTPVLGAVLNNINLNISSYYYSHYYDSSYTDYYSKGDEHSRGEILVRKDRV